MTASVAGCWKLGYSVPTDQGIPGKTGRLSGFSKALMHTELHLRGVYEMPSSGSDLPMVELESKTHRSVY